GIATDLAKAAVASRHADLPAFQFAGIQLQNLVHDGGGIHRTRRTGIADKSQSLLCQLCHAAHLLLCHCQILAGMAGVMARQVKQVDDGLERIVDLVRDRSGEPARGGELLAAADGFLGLFLDRNITCDGRRSHDFAARDSASVFCRAILPANTEMARKTVSRSRSAPVRIPKLKYGGSAKKSRQA